MPRRSRALGRLVALSLVAGLLLTGQPAALARMELASAAKPHPTPTPTPTPSPTPTPTPSPTPADPAAKIRGDLARLVTGSATLDPRIPDLVPAYVSGELPYFVLLSEPFDSTHRAAVESLGVQRPALFDSNTSAGQSP